MEKLSEAIENDNKLLKKIAILYLSFGSFVTVEGKLGFGIGEIELYFEDNPETSEEFDNILSEVARVKARREGSYKLFKVIDTLYAVLDDDTEYTEGGPSISDKVKAANALAKLLESPKSKKGDKEDHLDDILKQLEDEG